MAFNPVLARTSENEEDLVPLSNPPEKIVLKRRGISLEMKISGKKYSGKGFLFLTTKRCVFLKEGKLTAHKGWSSAEFPLGQMYSNEKPGQPPSFQQPVFGANFLEGCSPPIRGAANEFGSACVWSFSFKEGGCAKFVKVFYTLQRAAKRSDEAAEAAGDQLIQGGAEAFVDPTDPSIIFVQQPIPQQQYQFVPDQGWVASPWQAPPAAPPQQQWIPPVQPHEQQYPQYQQMPGAPYYQQPGYGPSPYVQQNPPPYPPYQTPQPPYAPQAHPGAGQGYAAPAPGYGAPAPGYAAPTPGYGAPTPGYGAPAPAYAAPTPGYGAPAPGYPTSGAYPQGETHQAAYAPAYQGVSPSPHGAGAYGAPPAGYGPPSQQPQYPYQPPGAYPPQQGFPPPAAPHGEHGYPPQPNEPHPGQRHLSQPPGHEGMGGTRHPTSERVTEAINQIGGLAPPSGNQNQE